MRAVVTGRAFHEAISKLKFVREYHHTSAVWLDVKGGDLLLKGTDMDTFVEVTVPSSGTIGPYRNPFLFHRIAGVATTFQKADHIEIADTEGGITLTAEGTEVFISEQEERSFLNPDIQIPSLNAIERIKVNVRVLEEILPFTSKDMSRAPILTAISVKDGHYAATDSYRLAHVYVPSDQPEHDFLIQPVPAKLLIANFRDDAVLTFHQDDKVIVSGEDFRMSFRTMIGSFPNYERLIPDSTDSKMELSCSDGFVEAAAKLHRLHKSLKFSSHTPVKISNANATHIRLTIGEEDSRCVHHVPGQVEATVAFNVAYLLDMFKGTNVDSLFGMDSLKPWGIREEIPGLPGAFRERVIMPVRASD